MNPESGEMVAEASVIPPGATEPSDKSKTAAEEREEAASKLVDRFSIWSGIAGLIPLPIVDMCAVGALQLELLRRISRIYDVPFSENSGKAMIASFAGTLIPASSGMGAASALKGVPLVGTLAAGFVTPALATGATYAIGKAFIQHFATGGTLLDFNPPDYRDFVKAHKEMWDSRSSVLGGRGRSVESPPGSSGHADNVSSTATAGS